MILKLTTILVIVQLIDCRSNDLIVSLPNGKIEGHWKFSSEDKKYKAFEGIPYAEPPVGDLRFMDPVPKKPWPGTWQAKTLSKCMQMQHYIIKNEEHIIGEEDCLHLNVYVSTEGFQNHKDVIVFIHGGAFMFNHGGAYGEKFLMDHADVIYVSINYRLGPLGFLSTEDEVLPGNAGLKDQRLALRWIKENIAKFGGNPDNIMLTGMSAGGASVQIHTLSKSIRKEELFHKAIAQSGSSLNPWVLTEKSREKAITIGELCGCTDSNLKNMLECLKLRPARQIVHTVKHFQPYLYNPFTPFGVVIDKDSKEPILHDHPLNILKAKDVYDAPIIFSSVQTEGLYPAAEFYADQHMKTINSEWNKLLPFILDYHNTAPAKDINNINAKIKEEYLQNKKLDKINFPSFLKMVSDRLFLNDITKAAKLHAAAIQAPVYYYSYIYRGKNSKSDYYLDGIDFGASHGDDTIQVLSTNVTINASTADKRMRKALQKLWLTFAKTSKAKVAFSWSWKPIEKTPTAELKYLLIKTDSDFKDTTGEIGNSKFWNKLNLSENEKLLNIKVEL